MTDYTKLVAALRCNTFRDDECSNSDCLYWSGLGCMDGTLCEDAADAIEALQAEIRESIQRCAECGDELEQKLQKRGEIVRCRECRWGHLCVIGQHLGLDGFCSKGEREVQE